MSFLNSGGVTKLVAMLKRRFASKEELQFVENAKQDVLVSGSNIVTINGKTLLRVGDFSINELPNVFSADNGKVLTVVNGAWAAAEAGGGGGDVIVFYVHSLSANNTLYADPALTITAMEFYGYDLSAAWSAVSAATAIKIMSGYGTTDEQIVWVAEVEYDKPEDSIDLSYSEGYNGAWHTTSIV